MRFDKKDLRKNFSKIAEHSRNIVSKTVDLGIESREFANKKLEEYSKRSQKADNVNATVSHIKLLEKYANTISGSLTEEEKQQVLKFVLVHEFELAYNEIYEEYQYCGQTYESFDKYIKDNEIYKFIVNTQINEIVPKIEEYLNCFACLLVRYREIIENSRNKIQLWRESQIDEMDFCIISYEILRLSEIANFDMDYENKGTYLTKMMFFKTINVIAETFANAETSTLRRAESELNKQSRNIEGMNQDEFERYNHNREIVDYYKENNQYVKQNVEERKMEKHTHMYTSRLFDITVKEIEELKKNAGM